MKFAPILFPAAWMLVPWLVAAAPLHPKPNLIFTPGMFGKWHLDEQPNLAAAHPDKTRELHARLLTWRKAVGAPMPAPHAPRAGRETMSPLDGTDPGSRSAL